MENTSNGIQNYYRFSAQQTEQLQLEQQLQQQQQQQQQQLQQNQQVSEHDQNIHSQHVHQSQHPLHTNFDQHDTASVLSFDPNFYTSHAHIGQFNNPNSSTSSADLNTSYKQLIEDHVLYAQQLKSSTDLASNTSASIPSNQFHSHDSLLIQQDPSNLMFDNNTTSAHNSNFIFQQQQQQLMNTDIQDMNVIANSFDHSELPLASSHNFERVEQQQRQEQDVFCELLSLATNSGGNRHQHEADPWHQNSDVNHFMPSFEEASGAPTLAQQQFHEQLLIHQQKKQNYYNPPASNPPASNPSNSRASPSSSVMVAEEPDEPLRPDESGSTNASHSDDRIYKLDIVQQPSRARMCGFGDKDRRPISPPPILQLIITTKYGQIINPETLDVSFLVVMCDSCQQIGPTEGDAAGSSRQSNPLTQIVSFPTTVVDQDGVEVQTAVRMRNLVGSSVSSATKLYDLDGNLGIFFIFQDVSLRTEGSFRLKFSLVDIGSPYSHSVNTTSISHVLKEVETEPFMVYTAKKFPGVVQSTLLSKCFARQGIKIPIRKEKDSSSKSKKRSSQSTKAEASEDDDEDDDI